MNQYPGYTLQRSEPCPVLGGTATILTHDISGATVMLLENQDENKAFGIGFGTYPSDDTGVFHILEHSVLAGSEKYPARSPFLQLIRSSMASFLNAMTFEDKTVYPFATPNETDYKNLMDVYLNAVFCPLAVSDRRIFEQEAWHREPDGSISGVVYNEMQGALASPEAQLGCAMDRALFPSNGYDFVSGGDPASIPGLSYEQFVRVYRRHYRADNCCILLYGRMDMADKLAFLDERYLSRMPGGVPRPATPMQHPQTGVTSVALYRTDHPEAVPAQCALGWYAGDYADREKMLAVGVLLDALLGQNQSPLKRYLLDQDLGKEIELSFDDSVQQPVVQLLLRGTDEARAARFAPAVAAGVEQICGAGIPAQLLLAALNSAEFAAKERPGSLPDGVWAAILAVSGWNRTGDPMAELRLEELFGRLRARLEEQPEWYTALARELFAPAPVQVTLRPVAALPQPEGAREDAPIALDHPLTPADLSDPAAPPEGSAQELAGLALLGYPSAGSAYLNFYYDLGGVDPEQMPALKLLADLLTELDAPGASAQELAVQRNTWLGECAPKLEVWTGRQPGRPCWAKFALYTSLLERNLAKGLELAGRLLYDTMLTGEAAEAALARLVGQKKLEMEQQLQRQGNLMGMMRAGAPFSVEVACSDRCSGIGYYQWLCALQAEADWAGLCARLEALRDEVFGHAALTVSFHGSAEGLELLRSALPAGPFAASQRRAAAPYSEPLPPVRREAFIIAGGVNYAVQAWPQTEDPARRVLAQAVTYDYLWREIRELGGAYGTGMRSGGGFEGLYTYRDPHVRRSYDRFEKAGPALAARPYGEKELGDLIVSTVSKYDPPRKPRSAARELDRRRFCGLTAELMAAERAAICGVTEASLHAAAAALPQAMAGCALCTLGSAEAIGRAEGVFDRVETLL